MIKTLGIVKGTLLTDKQRRQLSRRLAGKSVLEWVVRQMTDCARIDGVVVLTDNGKDGELVRSLSPPDVPLHHCDLGDTLACLVDTLDHFPAESCVFIGADWPFLDPIIVDQLVHAAESEPGCDYAAYQFVNECFSAGRPYGTFPEWYRAGTIREVNCKSDDMIHRQLPGVFFLDNQRDFTVELLPAPTGLDRTDVRLSVNDEDAWENVIEIHNALEMDVCDSAKLSELLRHQPRIRESMTKANEEALAEAR
ncbi:MAG TPA: hypothetical protein DEB39_07765 [Planctomycetaceae bacterium]|nr:hypothetical protein [Planctomycetaceae bacterium]